MIPAEGLFVIDNPLQTELLIAKLKAAVPLSATTAPSGLVQNASWFFGIEGADSMAPFRSRAMRRMAIRRSLIVATECRYRFQSLRT